MVITTTHKLTLLSVLLLAAPRRLLTRVCLAVHNAISAHTHPHIHINTSTSTHPHTCSVLAFSFDLLVAGVVASGLTSSCFAATSAKPVARTNTRT
jgi:hypothetical protein